MKKIKIDIEPIGKRIYIDKPTNGMKAISDAGIEMKSVCGGRGKCGKCRITILNGQKCPVSKQEKDILSPDEIKHGARLACQQVFKKNISIYIPSSSLSEEQKLQVTGKETKIRVDPVCRKYFIKLKRATLEDMESDFSRIKNALRGEHGIDIDLIDYKVLTCMPQVTRDNSWEITVTVRGSEIILVEGKDKTKESYGIAVDLGTTKIAIFLVDLITGSTVDKKGVMNPQISFGEDVMSRINFAMQGRENAEKIQKVVTDKINESIKEITKRNNLEPQQVVEMTLVGNTAMHHLFLGLPVRQLGLAPFISLTDVAINIKARELGIKISPGAYVYLLPPIAGYVGSDHLAMVLASNIAEGKGNYLGIDIGTNTEIVLKTKKGLRSVSTASGPAFEGAHIRHGMRAASGAIERVIIDSDSCIPKIQTINDKKPVGICGSGILDSIAELLKAGIINERGKFKPDSNCIYKDSQGIFQYMLNPNFYKNSSSKDNKGSNISINQKDIVEIQLAKSAMRTGIEVLLEDAGIEFGEISKVIIAGAFGSYIDPKNVINIGMFPNVSLKKISQVGNAAGVGAKMVLVSGRQREIAEKIAVKIKYLELTVFPSFSDHFAKSTLFPETREII